LHVKINEHIENDIVIAIDSTGIKVTNRGEWMRHKWHVRKGYLKLHVAVDTDKKSIVLLEITSEEVHDGKILKKLVDLDIFDIVLMSYARLSRKPLLFKSFTGLEITEFDVIFKEIESKYDEHKRKLLSNRKRKRDVGAGRPFKLKLRERFLMLLVYYRL